MLGAFAQFERSLIKQRQMEGIAKAKERGAYEKVGRKSSLSDEQVADMRKLKAQGVKVKDLMVQFGISRTSVYSYL
jgi:DNA invertase Pin-like site-specific DNA recombinase